MQEYSLPLQFSILDLQNVKVWAQYHIDTNNLAAPEWLDENSFLPLICDNINALKMQCHAMRLNVKAVSALNPDLLTFSDCAIYVLTKEAIYSLPGKFPGNFAMFGGLHIEQYFLVVHGQLVG